MSPEQVEGRPIDGRTDLYALGCAAFEMLTGRPPFQRDQDLAVMWAQVSAPPPSVRELRPELPAEVDRVISRALAKAPDSRQASCLQFAAELRDACMARPSGGTGAPTELAGTAIPSVAGPAATELAFAAPPAGPSGAPPSSAAHPPVGTGHAQGPGGTPPNEATITEAASGYSPPSGYGQSRYGQSGYGQGGYGAPGQTDQRWGGGSGYGQPSYQGPPPPRKRGRAVPILLGLLAVAILAGAAVFVLHLQGNTSPHTGPTTPVTITATPRTSGGSGSQSPSSSPSSSPATPPRPDAVLTQYYDAINNHDYRAAYGLNSQARSTESFATFKSGFAGTQHDNLTITGVNGDVVSFDLKADQSDGSVKTYQGTYTIRSGQIVGSNVRQIS
jgi:hypothetical protein